MEQPRRTASAWVGSLGGIGFLPGAPGTYATLVAAGVHILLLSLTHSTLPLPFLIAGATAACVILGAPVERALGRRDPREFVIDEVAGYWLAVLGLEAWPWYIVAPAAFVLFRLLDIIKPPPVGRFGKLPGGWGIVLDDLIAGACANLLVWAALSLIF